MATPVKKRTANKAIEAVPVEVQSEGTSLTPVENAGVLFTIKLDNKKIEGRTAEQVAGIILATQGSVAKYVVEPE